MKLLLLLLLFFLSHSSYPNIAHGKDDEVIQQLISFSKSNSDKYKSMLIDTLRKVVALQPYQAAKFQYIDIDELEFFNIPIFRFSSRILEYKLQDNIYDFIATDSIYKILSTIIIHNNEPVAILQLGINFDNNSLVFNTIQELYPVVYKEEHRPKSSYNSPISVSEDESKYYQRHREYYKTLLNLNPDIIFELLGFTNFKFLIIENKITIQMNNGIWSQEFNEWIREEFLTDEEFIKYLLMRSYTYQDYAK